MIKRLLPFLKGYRKQAVLAPLSVAIETVCELILPLLMAAIIDEGIQKGDMPAILRNGRSPGTKRCRTFIGLRLTEA